MRGCKGGEGGVCSGLAFRGVGPFRGETGGSWIYSGPVGSCSGAGGAALEDLNPYRNGKAACYFAEKTKAGKQDRTLSLSESTGDRSEGIDRE